MIYSHFLDKEIGTDRLSNVPKFHSKLAQFAETNLNYFLVLCFFLISSSKHLSLIAN
jgi:hypothetical protein